MGTSGGLSPIVQQHGVPFKRIGKILVATDESQIEKLRAFQKNAKQNGVSRSAPSTYPQLMVYAAVVASTTTHCRAFSGRCMADSKSQQLQEISLERSLHMQVHLEWLERDEALKMEPKLHCVAALWSPNTAIVDSHRCRELPPGICAFAM